MSTGRVSFCGPSLLSAPAVSFLEVLVVVVVVSVAGWLVIVICDGLKGKV